MFARKTGDFSNLSTVDLHLIALTYQLCRENLTEEEFNQLRTEPPKNIVRDKYLKFKKLFNKLFH